MNPETKSFVMNITTGVLVVALLGTGYFVFLKTGTTPAPSATPSSSVALVAQQTSSIGADIENTVQSLKNLSQAVENATVIFDLPSFKNLQDFSVPVPTDTIGRDNPFVPSDWKIKLKAAEDKANSTTGASSSQSSPSTKVVAPPQEVSLAPGVVPVDNTPTVDGSTTSVPVLVPDVIPPPVTP